MIALELPCMREPQWRIRVGGWGLRSFLVVPAVCNVCAEHVLLPLPVLRMPGQ